jgi:hypothetical protein
MKARSFAKEIVISLALCLFLISPAPLALILDKYPVLPKDICEIAGFIGGASAFSLYALQHFWLAAVLRSAIKKAGKFGKKGVLLPAIPLVFAVLAFISVGVHAVKLAPLGWGIYVAIFAFFYFATIALELFAPRWKWKPQICEIIFILLAFLLMFVAAPFITGTLNTVSADPFGFGFLLMLFTVYPVLLISAGIYLCIKIKS